MTSTKEPDQTRLTAAAIIQRKDGKFLFVEERAGGRIVLNQCSGGWQVGETLPETAQREAAEEGRVNFLPTKLLGTFITHHVNVRGIGVCSVRVAFAGELLPGTPGLPPDPAIIRTLWLSYDEICALKARHRSSAVLRCIEAYLGGKLLPIESLDEADDSA